jgi:ribosomal protein S27E
MLYFVTFPALWKPYRCVTMQVVCSGCNAKIKVPDKAAGKKIKCPRCATVLTVPMPDTSRAPEESAPPGSKPELPPPKQANSRAEEPLETPDEDQSDDLAVTEKPASGSKSPPPIKSKRASWGDADVEADEDERPSRRRRDRDDDDDEDEDDDHRSRRRRRDDDDDNDDDLDFDVRKRRGGRKRRGSKKATNGLAMTSMIMGIVAIVLFLGSCVCSLVFAPGLAVGGLSLILAIVAVILGHIGKTPGSEGAAMTGLICGYIVIVLSVLSIVLIVVLIIIFGAAFMAAAGAGGQGGPGGFRPPPPRRF